MKSRCWRRFFAPVRIVVAVAGASRRSRRPRGRRSRAARNPGHAGGGRAAPWIRANLTAQLEAIAAAGIGGVEITPIYGARGSEARYVDFLSPQLDGDARAHARGKRSAWGSAWTWRPAPAGLSAGPTVSAADGSSSLRAARREAGRQTDRDEGEAAGAGRRGAGARSVLDGRARSLPAPVLQGVRAGFPRDGACARQFHDSFEYYHASWTAALPEVFQKMHGYDIQSYARAIHRRAAARRRHARPHQGRLPAHAREAASRLRERLGDVGARGRIQGAQPGARRARQSAGPVRRRRYSRDRILRPHASCPSSGLRGDAVGVSVDPDPPEVTIGRFASSAAHVIGQAAGLERDADVAAREFPRVARRGEAAARPAVRRRHQSHFLSRHRVLAGRRRVARLVFLCVDAAHAVQSAVGRLRRDARLCRARAVGAAGGHARQRRAVVLAVRRCGRAAAQDSWSSTVSTRTNG